MSDDEILVDLADLLQIGEYHLPELANLHLKAAENLDQVDYLANDLFDTPVDTDSKSVAYEPWLKLYTECQQIMSDTVTILSDIAQGVVKTVEAYAEQDLSNAEQLELEKIMDSYANGDKEYADTDGEHGEKGNGAPPPKPGTPPAPKDVPDDATTKNLPSDGRSPDNRMKSDNERS